MFVDDINIFVKKNKNKNRTEDWKKTSTIRLYNQYIRMEFGINDELGPIMIDGKEKQKRNRPTKSGEHQNFWRKGNYEYLVILEADTIKQTKMKEK